MDGYFWEFIAIMASYLIGAVPFGLILGKWKGKDLRQEGSQNIGATNAGRVLGKKYFFLVLALDLSKGMVPTLLFPYMFHSLGFSVSDSLPLFCGLAAILGHIYPIYLKFKGGKGVATSAGVFLALMPLPFTIAFCLWFLVLIATKYMSLASIIGSITLAISFVLLDSSPWQDHFPTTITTFFIGGLILIRHRTNIQRLLQGKEKVAPFFRKEEKES